MCRKKTFVLKEVKKPNILCCFSPLIHCYLLNVLLCSKFNSSKKARFYHFYGKLLGKSFPKLAQSHLIVEIKMYKFLCRADANFPLSISVNSGDKASSSQQFIGMLLPSQKGQSQREQIQTVCIEVQQHQLQQTGTPSSRSQSGQPASAIETIESIFCQAVIEIGRRAWL